MGDNFPEWHVEESASLHTEVRVDGQSIPSILSKINKQISILYKRSTDVSSSVVAMKAPLDRLETAESNISTLETQLKALSALVENQSKQVQIAPAPVVDAENSVDNAQLVELNDKIANMESMIESLVSKIEENDSKYNEDIKNVSVKASLKFEKMDKIITELNHKIESLLEDKEENKKKIHGQSQKIQDVMTRIDQSNSSFADSIEKLFSKFQERDSLMDEFNRKLSENALSIVDIATKVHFLDEMRACHEVKIHNLEEDIFAAMGSVTENKKNIENVIEPKINNIFQSIDKFSDIKADRAELNLKADLRLLGQKANIDDLRQTNDEAVDLKQFTISQHSSTSEALKSLEKSIDKKLEVIMSAIFSHIKKELKNERDSKEGTDIGRIRCLVCDQFTNQKGNAHEGDTGGKLNPTIKMLVTHPDPTTGRPHPSVQFGHTEGGDSHNNNSSSNYNRSSPPRVRASSPPRPGSPKTFANTNTKGASGEGDDDVFIERELEQTYGVQFPTNQLDSHKLLPNLHGSADSNRGKNKNLVRVRGIHKDGIDDIIASDADFRLPLSSLQNSASDKAFPKRDYLVLSKPAVAPTLNLSNSGTYNNSNINIGANNTNDNNNITINNNNNTTTITSNNNSSNNNNNNATTESSKNRPGSAPAKRAIQGRLQAMGRPV